MRPGELATFFVSQDSKQSVEEVLNHFLKDQEMVFQMSQNTDLIFTIHVVECSDDSKIHYKCPYNFDAVKDQQPNLLFYIESIFNLGMSKIQIKSQNQFDQPVSPHFTFEDEMVRQCADSDKVFIKNCFKTSIICNIFFMDASNEEANEVLGNALQWLNQLCFVKN